MYSLEMVNYENLCIPAHIRHLINTQNRLTGPISNTPICLHCWWVNCQFNSLFYKNSQKWHTVISYAPRKCCDIDKMSSSFLGMTITINLARQSLRYLGKGREGRTQFASELFVQFTKQRQDFLTRITPLCITWKAIF